jgi:uncharacterized repeat protein (TIGR03803 family)
MKSRSFQRIQVLAILVVMLAATATALHAQTYKALHTYSINSGGYSGIIPAGLMSQGQDGNLYSTIQNNGTANFGTAFKITTAGQLNTIYNFCSLKSCADGSYPAGGLTLGTDGNLYGTTVNGGKYNAGTGFNLTPKGILDTMWSFTATGKDEAAPWYPPFEGQDGNFYGTAPGVYSGNYGDIYKITPKDKLTAYPLSFTNGANPNLPTQGTDDNFYGTAIVGGKPACKGYQYGCGVVYRMNAAGILTALWPFKGFYGNDGAEPVGVLVQGYDGNFYGTTYFGGTGARCSGGCGTVFKITPAGVETVLYNFTGDPDGAYPDTGLTLGTDGNFYGTTSVGGKNNYGAIFQITPAGKLTILYNFCSATGCVDGIYPKTPIMQHTNGRFYGSTSGNSLGGSVFYRLDMRLKPFARLVNWSGAVGATAEILGKGFTGTTKVSFNGTNTTVFTVVSDTYLTVPVPANATTGFVTVSTPGGVLKSSHKFLVEPAILNFSPTSGKVGDPVTINGTSFTGATKVTFGGVKATFSVVSDIKITTTVPTGAKTGRIQVTTPGGTATSATDFTVTP